MLFICIYVYMYINLSIVIYNLVGETWHTYYVNPQQEVAFDKWYKNMFNSQSDLGYLHVEVLLFNDE